MLVESQLVVLSIFFSVHSHVFGVLFWFGFFFGGGGVVYFILFFYTLLLPLLNL